MSYSGFDTLRHISSSAEYIIGLLATRISCIPPIFPKEPLGAALVLPAPEPLKPALLELGIDEKTTSQLHQAYTKSIAKLCSQIHAHYGRSHDAYLQSGYHQLSDKTAAQAKLHTAFINIYVQVSRSWVDTIIDLVRSRFFEKKRRDVRVIGVDKEFRRTFNQVGAS